MSTAKPIIIHQKEVNQLCNSSIVLYRKLNQKVPSENLTVYSVDSNGMAPSDVVVGYGDYNSEESFRCVYKCPYGAIGDYFWVKEPYYKKLVDGSTGYRVGYFTDKVFKRSTESMKVFPARRMKFKYARKVLRLNGLGIQASHNGDGYWKLSFDVLNIH